MECLYARSRHLVSSMHRSDEARVVHRYEYKFRPLSIWISVGWDTPVGGSGGIVKRRGIGHGCDLKVAQPPIAHVLFLLVVYEFHLPHLPLIQPKDGYLSYVRLRLRALARGRR